MCTCACACDCATTCLVALLPQGQNHGVQAERLQLDAVSLLVEHGFLPLFHVLNGHKQAAGDVEQLPQEAVCSIQAQRGQWVI